MFQGLPLTALHLARLALFLPTISLQQGSVVGTRGLEPGPRQLWTDYKGFTGYTWFLRLKVWAASNRVGKTLQGTWHPCSRCPPMSRRAHYEHTLANA